MVGRCHGLAHIYQKTLHADDKTEQLVSAKDRAPSLLVYGGQRQSDEYYRRACYLYCPLWHIT